MVSPPNNDMAWFEKFFMSLSSPQHKELINKMQPDIKASYLQAIMPAIMTNGREKYICRNVYHPGKTCSAYWVDKVIRATKNCIKITLVASLIPQIIKKRKHLFQSRDIRIIIRTLKLILIRYIRATLFLVLGTSVPFMLVCAFPITSLLFDNRLMKPLAKSRSIMLGYGTIPILALIVEVPTKMPGYMGFFF